MRIASRARTRSCPARRAASSAWCEVSRLAGFDQIIGFDMGGTSTDVSHYAGEYERAFETEVAGVRLRAPMMSIHTVAAGGGSICAFDGARFRVGPESAGANPGPGVLSARRPAHRHRLQRDGRQDRAGALSRRCSAPAATQPLDADVVREKFAALAAEIAAATGHARTPEEVAEGFLQIAVDNMAQRDQAHLGRSAATTSPNTRCAASAARAASTPAWSPTRSA